jgi:hypothetical protein
MLLPIQTNLKRISAKETLAKHKTLTLTEILVDKFLYINQNRVILTNLHQTML